MFRAWLASLSPGALVALVLVTLTIQVLAGIGLLTVCARLSGRDVFLKYVEPEDR